MTQMKRIAVNHPMSNALTEFVSLLRGNVMVITTVPMETMSRTVQNALEMIFNAATTLAFSQKWFVME